MTASRFSNHPVCNVGALKHRSKLVIIDNNRFHLLTNWSMVLDYEALLMFVCISVCNYTVCNVYALLQRSILRILYDETKGRIEHFSRNLFCYFEIFPLIPPESFQRGGGNSGAKNITHLLLLTNRIVYSLYRLHYDK